MAQQLMDGPAFVGQAVRRALKLTRRQEIYKEAEQSLGFGVGNLTDALGAMIELDEMGVADEIQDLQTKIEELQARLRERAGHVADR